MSERKRLHLGLLLNAIGFHIAAWRHPGAAAHAGNDLAHYIQMAQTAEKGLLDLIFLADSAAVHYGHDVDAMSRMAPAYHLEPTTLLSSLAAVTNHIGLVATMTTTYNEPYHIARRFATLDHLSRGRAGWNLVTSANQAEAHNFGLDEHVEHARRYERAREAAFVVRGLWDSWDDNAGVFDKEAGRYFDPAKLRRLDHKGKHFTVRGPLNVTRPPQGHPVIAQAGSSEEGKSLAAETAELVFTAQLSLETAQTFYRDVKQRVAGFGRAPDDVIILPGIVPFVGNTADEAKAEFERLQAAIHPEVGLALLRELLGGVDLSGYDLDGPVPALAHSNAGKSRLKLLMDMAQRENLTIRQLYQRAAGARGHWTVYGSATDIADRMEEWLESDAADGFVIIPPYLPGTLDRFVELVIPELQRRGLFRSRYEADTLRGNLGLRRPERGEAPGLKAV